jgi:uncharacterized protein (DUF302 family)
MEQIPPTNPASAQANAGTAGLVTLPSRHGAAQTLDQLESLLRQRNIRIFARIDHAQAARDAGLTLRPTQVLIFGNPQAGTPVMQANQTVGIDLPLKVLAWEDADGKSWLTCNDPQYLFERHGIRDKGAIATAMAGLLHELATAAAG